jgi:hypothetical protein
MQYNELQLRRKRKKKFEMDDFLFLPLTIRAIN